jgi:hypothetical protein
MAIFSWSDEYEGTSSTTTTQKLIMLTDLRCDADCLILHPVRVFITSFCNNIYNVFPLGSLTNGGNALLSLIFSLCYRD